MNVSKYIVTGPAVYFFLVLAGCASNGEAVRQEPQESQEAGVLCKAQPVDADTLLDGLIQMTDSEDIDRCLVYSTIDWILLQQTEKPSETRKLSCRQRLRVCVGQCRSTFYPNTCVRGCYRGYQRCRRDSLQP